MDTSNTIALGALLVAIAGLGVSVWAVVYARRSANEARHMRQIEAERRRDEREDWHRDREPNLPPEVELEYRDSPGHGPGNGALWATVAIPDSYQMRAFAVAGDTWFPLSPNPITRPGWPAELLVEQWPHGKTDLEVKELVFRFWPPSAGESGAAQWRCDCGRPTQVREEGKGHWERHVKVRYHQPFAGSL